MKIAIVGYGLQGQSIYNYYHQHNEITVCDQNINLQIPKDAHQQLGKNYLKNLSRFDLIFRSPIIHPQQIISNNSPSIISKITSNTSEFLKLAPTKNTIGITGTKGKGTTSSLIYEMLKQAGLTTYLGGNIGTPPLDLLTNNSIKKNDWVVLELANFQTMDLKLSTHIAVCLMVVPEHLDWHKDQEEYFKAKKRLFDLQTKEDIAIYFKQNNHSSYIVSNSLAQKIAYYQKPGAYIDNHKIIIENNIICDINDVKLKGQHNLENICAAITTVWQIKQDLNSIRQVLQSFQGLPHRLELVRTIKKINFINDSFGTTPETAVVAIKTFPNQTIMILGGSSKNSNFNDLAQTIKKFNLKKIILIGQEAKRIQQALDLVGYQNYIFGDNNMVNIVQQAYKLAEPGDNILLSTACASFDMFKNYIDRGEQFKAAVLALQ